MTSHDDLWPAWLWIDSMERQGEMAFEEAKVWMDGIYGLMALCGLKPGDLLKGERDFQDLPQRLNKRFRAIFLCA